MRCLIVDDEPLARKVIESYCAQLPHLEVVGSCATALEAREVLQREKVDLLFLDINMPVMDGLSFLKTMRHAPQIVFTTAYKEYALDAFDLAATDYLLKPFSLERFIIALDKAAERLQPAKPVPAAAGPDTEQYFFLKSDGKIYKLLFQEILYAEANGNYTRIVTAGGSISPVLTLTALAELLPASIFIRVHRSFIINKSKIHYIEGNRVFINEMEIPVGSNYKSEFLRLLGLS